MNSISSWRKVIDGGLYILDTDSKIFGLILLDPLLLKRIEDFARDRRISIGLVASSSSRVVSGKESTKGASILKDSWTVRFVKDKEAHIRLTNLISASDSFCSAFLALNYASGMPVFKRNGILSVFPFWLKRLILSSLPLPFQHSKISTASKLLLADWFDYHEINYFDEFGGGSDSSRQVLFATSFLSKHGRSLPVYLVTSSLVMDSGIKTITYSDFFERIGARSIPAEVESVN